NFVGYGFVLPFEVIYLHDVRGFTLGTSGLIVAVFLGTAAAGGPIAGPVIDRLGARTTLMLSLAILTLAWTGLAFITRPWQGFLCALVGGLGNVCYRPSQSTLLVALLPRDRRHVGLGLSRVAMNIGAGA